MLTIACIIQGALFGFVLSKTQLSLAHKIPMIFMNSLLLAAVVAGTMLTKV